MCDILVLGLLLCLNSSGKIRSSPKDECIVVGQCTLGLVLSSVLHTSVTSTTINVRAGIFFRKQLKRSSAFQANDRASFIPVTNFHAK